MGIFGGDRDQSSENAVEILRAVDSAALHDALLFAVRRGWMLSFGASRDGWAASVSVLVAGAKPDRAWCETTDELERALTAICEAAAAVDRVDTAGDVKKARKPKN